MTAALYITPVQAAAELGCARNTIHRAIARGELPAVKLGTLVRIRRADFDGWLNAHPAPKKQSA